MNRWLIAIAGRTYVWALARDLVSEGVEQLGGGVSYPFDPDEVRRIAWREISAIRESILAHFDYQDREARILNDRLSRRYDPGQAVNEAANRAIAAKKAAGEPSPDNLTEKQKLALRLQEQTVKERIARS